MKKVTQVLSEKDFKNKVRQYSQMRKTFDVHETRGKNYYLYDDKERLVARGRKGQTKEFNLPEIEEGSSIFGKGISFSQGLAITTRVKDEVRGYLQTVVKPEPIIAKYSTTQRDQKHYKEIDDGAVFYSVDINHAYFQVLKKLGYITDEFYERYKDQDHYKIAFIFSCSWLVSRRKVYRYKHGIYIGMLNQDKDEKRLKVIYDNVRHHLQNLLGELYERLDNGAFWYLTDEIFVKKEALADVKAYFREKGFEFKINICRKIDNMKFNKANVKVHKPFGMNAEKTKEELGKVSSASTEMEEESQMRATMRNVARKVN